MILAAVVFQWFSGGARHALFDEAEVQFLFPAPVSRLALLHYRMAKGADRNTVCGSRDDIHLGAGSAICSFNLPVPGLVDPLFLSTSVSSGCRAQQEEA